ncbi:hypothetical protein IVB56_12360 [Bradyrhizobium sp. CW7]|uniref:hypothetical protein n=1 Tax=Bradyrhizobium sp. CW7 TaxID=2782688 RepID=UPI001FFBA427|nr:hypothetical protein [Bradyrhizobium sp. CW7]MCK1351878.1 hypothetical protein [Bradyrhizobium sp. CW7]
MSQVAKSASAFVRALLAILALELEDSKREADTLASEFGGHGGPIGLNPAAKRGGKGNWQSNHSNDGAGEFKRKPYELVGS